VHLARHAMMKQLYWALMAYADEEFWAQIPAEGTWTPEQLEEMGFTWDPDKHPRRPSDRTMVVRAKKASVMIERFAQMREGGEDRQAEAQTVMVFLQSLEGLINGPLGVAIGSEQALELINLTGRALGWPRDFKLRNATPAQTPQQQAEMVKQQLSGFIAEIEQKILGEVKQGLMPIMQHDKEQDQALEHLSQIIEAAQAHRPPMGVPGLPPGMPVNPVAGPPVGPPPMPVGGNGQPVPPGPPIVAGPV